MYPDRDDAPPPSKLPFRRPPWPFRTRAWRRVRWLLLAPMLALLLEGSVRLGLYMVVDVDPNDHAIVWVTGTEEALAATESAVAAHGVLLQGHRAAAPVFDTPAPLACPDADAFVFSRLHPHELRIAAEELRRLARESGARPCAGNMFIFDEVPALGAPGALHDNLMHVAWLAGVPLVAVLIWPWGLGERLGLPRTWAWAAWHRGALLRGLCVGLALVAVAWPLRHALRWLGWTTPLPAGAEAVPGGLGSMLLFFLLLPFLAEVAYRGWAQPLAAKTVGARLAPVAVVLVAALATQPAPHQWPALVLLHLSLGLLLQRGGSLAACIVAHVVFATGIGLLP